MTSPANQRIGTLPLVAFIIGTSQLAWRPSTVRVLDAVSRAAEIQGAGLMVLIEAGQPSLALRSLTGDGLVSGVLMRAQAADHGWVRELSNTLPTVMMGAHTKMPRTHVVEIENVESSATLVGAMFDAGAERLAMVSGTAQRADSHLRFEGFQLAHRLRGRSCDPSMIFPGDYTRSGGYAIADAVLDSEPDGIFAANDETARGIIERAEQRGLQIPHDLMIAGFDGSGDAPINGHDLATVQTPWDDLACTAVETLLGLVGGMDLPMERLVTPEVYLGETVRSSLT